MIAQHAGGDGAEIRRRLQVAILIKRTGPEARPVGQHAPALYCAARDEYRAAHAMIGALRAVHRDGAAELADDEDGGVLPRRTKAGFQGGQATIQREQVGRQRTEWAGLVHMAVPAAELDHRDALAVRRTQEFRRGRHQAHERLIATARAAHPDAVGALRIGEICRELRIGFAIERSETLDRVAVGRRQQRRRPGGHIGGPAHHQRHMRVQGNAQRLAGRRHLRQRAVEPAGVEAVGLLRAVLKQVLAVEMRTVAIGRGRGMDEDHLAGIVERLHAGQVGMKCEGAIKPQRAAALARWRDRQSVARAFVIRIAVSGRGGETVHRAAQKDDDQALVGLHRGQRGARQAGGENAAAE